MSVSDPPTLRHPPVDMPAEEELPAPGLQRPHERWKIELAAAIRDPDTLIDRLQLPDELRPAARRAAAEFPVVVPESYVARMRVGDPTDPLLRQVLPLGAEMETVPGYTRDAVGDLPARSAPGLLHKYAGRALLIAARECAVHCRYCFRRHYPYSAEPMSLEQWAPALEALAADSSIHEVLLSGGDPLLLSHRRLAELLQAIERIPHVRRVRIHTRLPIVIPSRINEDLIELLSQTRLTPIMVVHANHAREIVGDCAESLRRLVRSGITTLNQSVLLRGVNDESVSLTELSERLIDLGVIPYYLHQLDRVAGAAHFAVDDQTGVELMRELRSQLPGYAVPDFVRETAGALSKLPVAAADQISGG